MKVFGGYLILAVSFSTLLYFVYSLVWFLVVGRRAAGRTQVLVTILAYLAVLISVGIWLWPTEFPTDTSWYERERILMWVGVSLCVGVLGAVRFAARGTAIPLGATAFIVALNWIGSFQAH